jgi:hypothetical protein
MTMFVRWAGASCRACSPTTWRLSLFDLGGFLVRSGTMWSTAVPVGRRTTPK